MSKKTTNASALALAIAALGVELAAGAVPVDVRLIPAGEFRAWDGRPTECAVWICTDEDGLRLVAEAEARVSAVVIDYEHATLHAKKTGTQAPAAGWYKQLEWRPGDGLWAIGVDWTAAAAQWIAANEYRYISPVFSYDAKTGRVQKLFHAALTNDPGLDGLTDLAALAASLLLDQPSEEQPMDELLEQLRWLLNLPVGATAEDVIAQLQKLMDQLKGDGTAAASFDLAAHLAAQAGQIATLSAQLENPDPAKFVPIATLTSLQAQHAQAQTALAALQAEVAGGKLDKAIEAGKAAGKLTPATEAWARDLGKKDFAALTAYLAAAPVVIKPGSTQTGGKAHDGPVDVNDGAAIAEAALAYQVEQAGKGLTISTVDAVAHITKHGG